jgi:hypothetical protein
MDNMLSRRLAQGATLVVDDMLCAVQLEAYLAREGDLLEASAWLSPDIQTHDDWCASLWAANFERDRLLLSSTQSDALWRRVVAASPAGAALIDTARIATWARQAWDLLHAWQLDFRQLRSRDDDPGFRNFLEWAAQFEAALRDSGWLDRGSLTRLVATNLGSGATRRQHRKLSWTRWAGLGVKSKPGLRRRSRDPCIESGSRTLSWSYARP